MGFFSKLKLGALAVDVVEWARDVIKTLDFDALLRITQHVVEIERTMRGQPGFIKLRELLSRIAEMYPGGNVAVISGYVKVLVALLNGLGVFKK